MSVFTAGRKTEVPCDYFTAPNPACSMCRTCGWLDHEHENAAIKRIIKNYCGDLNSGSEAPQMGRVLSYIDFRDQSITWN